MTLALLVLIAALCGYLVHRWEVVVLGPLAGLAVLGLAIGQQRSVSDNPALFVAVAATLALAAGVTLRRVGPSGGRSSPVR
ncbi:MAG: hypothetical protein M3Z98_00165 [Candidatus Dormibacteraeota bacterium]|nr:hypothetical protein [Candidatus Dormibacteraeota bacterium]